MKKRSVVCLMVAFLLCCCLAATAQTVQKPMTNADVLAMAKSGISEDTIVLAIQKATTDFDTSPDAIIALKGKDVPEKVLAAMLSSRSETGGTPINRPSPPPNRGASKRGLNSGTPTGSSSESRALIARGFSGFSFGLPNAQAVVATTDGAFSVSPKKTVLLAPTLQIGVKTGKYVIPFFDLTFNDTGSASASAEGFT
jgi:hypothetical protein